MVKDIPKNKAFRKMFGISMGLCRAELYMPTHVFNTADVIGRGHDDIIFSIKDGKITGYFSEDVIKYMGEHGLKVLSSKDFVKKNQQEATTKGKNLFAFSEYIESLPLKYLSDEELLRNYEELFEKIQEMFGYFNVSQPCISMAIEKELDKQMKKSGIDADTQYKITEIMLKQDKNTLIEEEEKDIIKISLQIREKNLAGYFKLPLHGLLIKLHYINRQLYDRILLHSIKSAFLASSENYDEFCLKYHIDRLKEHAKKNYTDLKTEQMTKTPDKIALKNLRNNLIRKYDLNDRIVHLLDISRIYSHQRMEVRIYWTKAINVWGKILREYARRMNISENEIQYILKDEIKDFFKTQKMPDDSQIKKRMDFCIYAIFDRKKPMLLTGKKALSFERKYLKEEYADSNSLKGMPASKGTAKGKVKVLAYGKNMVSQIEEMQQGDILVTGNTRPDMIIAMKKAKAIVTDEGGILSHAALVSRELSIPCIVGTKDATKIFKDGDIVEVDADNGIVRRIDINIDDSSNKVKEAE